MRIGKILGSAIEGLALATIVGGSVVSSEYTDIMGFSEELQAGRTKNSIAAVTAGIIGQKMYGDSDVDLEIQKQFYPDARVVGKTTSESVDTKVDLTFTSSRFTGHNNAKGRLEGEVDKSEFNWNVKQSSKNRYDIARWGPKFDAALELTVKDGVISGTYIRPGPHFDWDVTGTYDANGNVNYEIDGPFNLGITLNGKITPRR